MVEFDAELCLVGQAPNSALIPLGALAPIPATVISRWMAWIQSLGLISGRQMPVAIIGSPFLPPVRIVLVTVAGHLEVSPGNSL